MLALPYSVEVVADSSPGINVRSRHSSLAPHPAPPALTGSVVGNHQVDLFKKTNFEVPLSISRRFRDVQFKTLVAISPLVPCAMYSVDDTVVLWRFRDGKESTVQCDGVVTCLSLGVPAPWVFDVVSVKYILVVATENSVSIIPLDSELQQTKSEGYFLPSSVNFSQVSVTATGRILLWTPMEPSTVYELRYRAKTSWFKSKVFFQYHSLLYSSSASFLDSVISKLMMQVSLSSPPHGVEPPPIKLFIQPEATFRFFVSIDSTNVSLYEISDLGPCEAATGSWRHSTDQGASDLVIKCIAKMQLSDLALGTVTPRILFASVNVTVDTGEPCVELVTDHAELLTLRCLQEQLVVAKSRSHNVSLEEAEKGKRQKVSSSEDKSCCSIGTSLAAEQVFATAQGTKLTVSSPEGGGSSSQQIDINASILAIAAERPVEQDLYGPFVLPSLTASESSGLIPPLSKSGGALIVLTGKGVTLLEVVEAAVTPTTMPRSVSDIVRILSSPNPNVIFAYKPIFIRAITEEVQVASLQAEQDYCCREKAVKPVSGSLWIAGVQRLAKSLLFVLEQSRVSVSPAVLEAVGARIRNLVKLVRQVLLVSNPSSGNRKREAEIIAASSFKRREFMHLGHETREQVLKNQAIWTLNRIIDSLSFSGQVVSFFALLPPDHLAKDDTCTLGDFFRDGQSSSVLSRLCENLIKRNATQMHAIVEKLKLVAPSILCSVSPAAVPFSPEGIAAMLQCALDQGCPVGSLLESVQTLARSTPALAHTLTEVTRIIRALKDKKELVLEAMLDGLQERLIDAVVVKEVLAWTGSTLSGELNELVLEYLFSHGNWLFIDEAACVNQFIEKYLQNRLAVNPTYSEVYAKVQARAGRANVAGDVLEKAAFGSKNISISDRIALLEKAQEIYPVHRRLELATIARHIQLPLSERDLVVSCSNSLLSVSDLHLLAKERGFFDLVLTCYLFVPVKEAEIIKTWTHWILSDLSYFSSAGILKGIRNLHEISKQVESLAIWRKPELVAALLEYLACLVQAPSGWVAREFLIGTLRLSPQQSVEVYSKMIREINVWLVKIPSVKGDFTAPSLETVRARLVDQVVALAQAEMHDMHLGQLQSVLILIKNYLKEENQFPALSQLIDKLGAQNSVLSQALPGI